MKRREEKRREEKRREDKRMKEERDRTGKELAEPSHLEVLYRGLLLTAVVDQWELGVAPRLGQTLRWVLCVACSSGSRRFERGRGREGGVKR